MQNFTYDFIAEHFITGKGLVIDIILRSGEIKLGDNIIYNDELYIISGMEITRNIFNIPNSRMGLILRKSFANFT